MYIQVILCVKYLVTVLALVSKTVGEMDTFNMLHQVTLLIVLFATECARKLHAIKIVHFGDVVL